MAEKIWTSLELVKVTAEYLQSKGVGEPRLAAELLLAHTLGVERIALYTRFDQPLETDEVDAFRQLVRRRAAREPVQYILGRAEFYSLTLEVRPGALIPRPETELLVELALKTLGDGETTAADMCAGSGCCALAIAHNAPRARVWATDVATAAVDLARSNAERLNLADRVTVLEGSFGDPLLAEGLGGSFDAVVCNPPYVSADEMASLQPEVRDHEPREALVPPDGRPDSLYEPALASASALLRAGGFAAFEIDPKLAGAVAAAMGRAGFENVLVGKDFSAADRAMTGVRAREANHG